MSTTNAEADKPAAKPAAPARKTAEQWAAEKTTPAWLFAATKARHAWPIGKELTADEYQKAVDAAANTKVGG